MKTKTNECTLQSRNRLTGMENKLMVSSGKRERETRAQEVQTIIMYKMIKLQGSTE